MQQNNTNRVPNLHERLVVMAIIVVLIFIVLKVVFL